MKESESLSNDETLAVARMQNMSVFQSNSLVGITFTMSNNKHKERMIKFRKIFHKIFHANFFIFSLILFKILEIYQ